MGLVNAELDLADWRRTVAGMYADVRASLAPEAERIAGARVLSGLPASRPAARPEPDAAPDKAPVGS